MYKIFFRIFILIFLLILTLIIYLSYFGIKTARFNDLIIEKLNQTYPGINVKLSEVFLKLDITNKEIKISTKEPKLINNNLSLIHI